MCASCSPLLLKDWGLGKRNTQRRSIPGRSWDVISAFYCRQPGTLQQACSPDPSIQPLGILVPWGPRTPIQAGPFQERPHRAETPPCQPASLGLESQGRPDCREEVQPAYWGPGSKVFLLSTKPAIATALLWEQSGTKLGFATPPPCTAVLDQGKVDPRLVSAPSPRKGRP